MKKEILAAALLALVSHGVSAQSIQKYFGYLVNDVNAINSSSLGETESHINLHSMTRWSEDMSDGGRSLSEQMVLDQLELAKAAHVQMIIPAAPFVFNWAGPGVGGPCWSSYEQASQTWNHLVQRMVAGGYLIPSDPDRSVVAAIYVVDEPNGKTDKNQGCLDDQNQAANPALVNAIQAIKGNPNTQRIPLATILSTRDPPNYFDSIAQGIKLFDWVGFDNYMASTIEWNKMLAKLKLFARSDEKLILVPGTQIATQGCAAENTPSQFIDPTLNDPQVVWLAPFTWSDANGCTGLRDLPALQPPYKSIGAKLKAQGCASSIGATSFCKGTLSNDAAISYLLDD